MKESRIHILTGPIKSGKSTFLANWTKQHSAAGFLTPVVNDLKWIFDLSSTKNFPFQSKDFSEDCVAIGNYLLLKSAFQIAEKIIKEAVEHPKDWIVLDEIGKLELKNEGHHDLVLAILEQFPNKILFVIRDSCLQEVLEKYKIKHFSLIKYPSIL